MYVQSLIELFKRDLLRLKSEIERYSDNDSLWQIEGLIKNSGGNLCLHLIGNLRTFIGNALGKSGYERNRAHEFSAKNVNRDVLLAEIDVTIKEVEFGLNQILVENLTSDFPIQIWDKKRKMDFTLIHLYGHLNYHLGQINYHRRLVDGIKNTYE